MAEKPRKKQSTQFDLANRLFFRLYQCSNLLHKSGTRYVAAFGATTQQWAVLGALARPQVLAAGMTVKDLITFLMVSRQNLTAVLDRLESRGWIERVEDNDDRRSRRIRLTTLGQRTWTRMQSVIAAYYDDALADFAQADRVRLARLLDRLKDALNAV